MWSLPGELGATDDPNRLVPGDVASVYETSRHLRVYAGACEHVGSALKKIDEGYWYGQAATRFRECFDLQPKRWNEAADAFEKATLAVETYAGALAEAKRQAAEAVARWRRGVELTKQAQALNPLLVPADHIPGIGGVLGSVDTVAPDDPGAELRASAKGMLSRARQHLREVGDQAARQVAEARDLAPPEPTLLEKIGSFLDGAREELEGTLEAINPENWGDLVTGAQGLFNLATQDLEAAVKQLIDYETMRDDSSKWLGGLFAGALLSKGSSKLGKVGGLPDGLSHHIFAGDPREGRLSGYHHRYGGVDSGDLKLVELIGQPDRNGVYMAEFEGVDLLGNVESKTSTFFPDSWTPARVESAIESAFDAREPVYNRLGEVLPHKWQARVDGVLIEGMIRPDSTATFESVKLYDVGTAYPKYEP